MPRGTPLDLSSGTKTCPGCKTNKPLTEFQKSSTTVHGYQTYCKSCNYARHSKWRENNLGHAAGNARKWRAENPERSKDHTLKANYGVPIGTYKQLFKVQNGCCAICGTTNPKGRGRFHLDHCHETGIVRGLLCHHCNIAIGGLQHNEEILLRAIDYLRQFPITLPESNRKC